MEIKKETVEKALESLESHLPQETEEEVEKSSAQDLDQPEGADLGAPGKKMSDASPKGKAKTKKSEDGDEDDEDEDEDEEKSFARDLPDEIQTKIDVSEFLKSLVDHTGTSIDELRTAVVKSENERSEQFENLAKAVIELHEGQGKLAVVLKAICQRIGVIENQPAARPKAETSIAKSQVADREFSSSLQEQGEEPVFKGLSENPMVAKAQMSNALTDLVKKGEAEDLDLINFESSSYLRPELVTKLKHVAFN